MYVALQVATALAITSEPFLPFTSEKLKNILQLGTTAWEQVKQNPTALLPTGHKIGVATLCLKK